MEGHGVTNYDVTQPSYGYTTSTTQFDDALLQHNVINRTQTITAKGATVAQAQDLLRREQEQTKLLATAAAQQRPWYDDDDDNKNDQDSHEESDSDSEYNDLLDNDNDEIVQRYQQLRVQEYQQQQKKRGFVESIRREDWTIKVNQASSSSSTQEEEDSTTCVIVCVTTPSSALEFLESCTVLAQKHLSCSFVSIPATEAFVGQQRDPWSHSEPSILVYRHGSLWRQYMRIVNYSSLSHLDHLLTEVWDLVE
jgi:hypothetical protein